MSPEMRAAQLRFFASLHDRAAAQLRFAAEATLAASEMRKLADQMQAANDIELAAHPDLAELNVRLDGYYDGV